MSRGNDGLDDERPEGHIISEGGMGQLWLVSQNGDRWVRKRIKPHFYSNEGSEYHPNPDILQLFETEIAAHQQCSGHPAIPAYRKDGKDNGIRYLEMEYVPEGRSLKDILEENERQPQPTRLSIPESLGYLLRIGGALQHCHERGVLHQDVTPGNILVTDGREGFLIDFGLAYFQDETKRRAFPTADSSFTGVPRYSPPEQWRGEVSDEHSDIYTFGVSSFYLLTGKHPVEYGQVWFIREQILRQSPPEPRSINPDISPHLEGILLRCLEKERSLRYQSMGEVVEELEKAGREL